MRQRWLSRRAVLLHVALVVWFPGCLVAFWWQVHRAFSGNGLSYLYSVEWPVFAVTGVWAWWQLVHTDPDTVGRRAQERMAAGAAGTATAGGAEGAPAVLGARPGEVGIGAGPDPLTDGRVAGAARLRQDEDPELAAYNDRLARLATQGPKTWRRR